MNKADIAALAMPAADAVAWADWEKWAEKSLEEFAVEVVRLYQERIDAEQEVKGMVSLKEKAVCEIIDRCVAPDMYAPARGMLDAMIAAAQGERNAD